MRRLSSEVLAVLLVVLVLVGVPGVVIGLDRAYAQGLQTVRLRAAEHGGFEPAVIHARAGEVIRLRLIGEDVVHGALVRSVDPDSDFRIDLGPVYPGKPRVVEFTVPEEGVYVVECTVVCSPEHGRMRARIVAGP